MKKYIWISVIFLFSCGTQKVDKTFDKHTTETESKGTTETKAETTSEVSQKTLLDFFESNMNFAIKPIGELPAKFVFNYNGQKIEGETSGEINFTNQQTKIKQETETITKIKTTFQTKTNYQTQTTFKSVQKEKHSESKRSEFAWYILAFILGGAFGVYLTNKFKLF